MDARNGRPRTARQRARSMLAGALVVGLLLVPGAASAQQQAAKRQKKVIRLETITVEGRIQKPQAFYILQRSNLNFEELERNESFLPKVVRSVDKDPF